MIQIKWSRRDDPDLMMIQIEWWSSCDEPVVMMMQILWWRERRWLEDSKTKKNWRERRWLEDSKKKKTQILKDLKMTRWSSWCREEYQCWKLCRKITFLVKRECWCIYNFRMYSSMYHMYHNPMFIMGCIYNVIESCCHVLMFRSGEAIM